MAERWSCRQQGLVCTHGSQDGPYLGTDFVMGYPPPEGFGQRAGAPEPEFVTWTESLSEGPLADVLRRQMLADAQAEEARVRAALTGRVRTVLLEHAGMGKASDACACGAAGVDHADHAADIAVGVVLEFLQRGWR